MELMSSLLLCALAALLPHALGVKRDVRIEAPMYRKTVFLKRKIPSEGPIKMILQYLRATKECSLCIDCINNALNAIKAEKTTESMVHHIRSRDFILNDIENNDQYKIERYRRETENGITTKAKRSQVSVSKNVTVSKYSIDGQVYALKLREKNSTRTELQQQSCHVYSIIKHHPCASPQAELIFANAKKKVNKRSKKQARNTLTTSTGKPQTTTRRSQVPSGEKVLAESFMTSIEELYN